MKKICATLILLSLCAVAEEGRKPWKYVRMNSDGTEYVNSEKTKEPPFKTRERLEKESAEARIGMVSKKNECLKEALTVSGAKKCEDDLSEDLANLNRGTNEKAKLFEKESEMFRNEINKRIDDTINKAASK